MATDVIMPALGVAQEKGILIRWFKAEGEEITKGEPLMEVETDKATVEVEAPASGTLANVHASPGDEVPVGHRIAVLLARGEKIPHSRARPSTPPRTTASTAAVIQTRRELENKTQPAGVLLASPAARRIAREKGIDLAACRGSGPQGAILADDIRGLDATNTLPGAESQGISEVVKLTRMRRIVGERMSRSKQTAPHFYVSMDMDMTEVSQQRRFLKEQGESPVPTINDFVLRATAGALRSFPSLNATFS
ncbi:MAG TPA: biotin/lipoyl-containing protein, partial [Terriglobales bacterium]|nr:biotin/lipoyl-containing protein [Terriglobales bacterium]